MAEWDAEIEITVDLVRALVAKQHPDLAHLDPVPAGEGFDNAAFRVGEWIFRIPRRTFGRDAMAIEIAWLPRIAADLPLAIPVPERIGTPSDLFPWPWAGYRMLPGETADRLDPPDDVRARWAEPLAEFLAALHALPVPADAPPDTITRHDHRRRAAKVLRHLETLDDSFPVAEAVTTVEALVAVEPWDGTPVLSHGDLYARHLLVEEGRITGVIDWGDFHAGDRAVDLALGWTILPPAARATFLAAYGPVDDATWARARFRAIQYGALLVPYGRDVDDPVLVEVGRRSLASALNPETSA